MTDEEKIYIIEIIASPEIISRISFSISSENYHTIDPDYNRTLKHPVTQSMLAKVKEPKENSIKFLIKAVIAKNWQCDISYVDPIKELFINYFNSGYFEALEITAFYPIDIPKENFATFLRMKNLNGKKEIVSRYIRSFEVLGISNTQNYWKLQALTTAMN